MRITRLGAFAPPPAQASQDAVAVLREPCESRHGDFFTTPFQKGPLPGGPTRPRLPDVVPSRATPLP